MAQQQPGDAAHIQHPYLTQLTKYERTKLIGMRAEQLARSAQTFVDIDPTRPFDPCEVAERELAAGRMPFMVRRTLPDGKHQTLSVSAATTGEAAGTKQ